MTYILYITIIILISSVIILREAIKKCIKTIEKNIKLIEQYEVYVYALNKEIKSLKDCIEYMDSEKQFNRSILRTYEEQHEKDQQNIKFLQSQNKFWYLHKMSPDQLTKYKLIKQSEK